MSSFQAADLVIESKHFLQLDLAADGGLAGALGLAEAAFSEDVLPCDAELMAPADFYAALASGPRRTRTTATAERSTLFPCLAA
ncbi:MULTISPECIES: hypothetical protein [unclassified Bradyrhizobium]